MPAVSVITPIYQSEALLPACVESVQRQTFPDWELLLIDDGSTDRSAELCRRFAQQDPRIRVFTQPENAGVSAARNRGLAEARGEYIAFLDADDQFVPRTLETLWRLREEAGADTAGCAHWYVWPDGREKTERFLPAGVYHRAEIRERLVLPLFGERIRAPLLNGYLWRVLFSADRIRTQKLTFEGAYLEDELFLLEYACGAEKLAVTEEPLYRCLMNPASATRRYMKDIWGILSRYMERKEEIAARFDLDRDCPRWRDNSHWANLLIAIGNEYARGNDNEDGTPKSFRDRRRTIEELCRRPEMAKAIREYPPEGMGRNKQMVAFLVRRGWFRALTLLYRLKNRM